MIDLANYPLIIFAVSFIVLWLSERIGSSLLKRQQRKMAEDLRADFGVILSGTLTLLGLLIGFTFSMAISRYDERKNYEEAEANAIGTEYLRADLLPAGDAANMRELLKRYTDQRILFYETRDNHELQQINSRTAQLQSELWSAVRTPVAVQPTPVVALAISGMNEVLNSQGYTQAAWWNRIPFAAWAMMSAIAICASLLVGYGARKAEAQGILALVLPLVVSIAFLLIADIDSPRGGIVRVRPQNLESFAQSLPSA
jgi:hypothetical protein